MDLEEQYNKLLKYCYAKVKNREQAEDIVQEAFLRFWQISSYRSMEKEKAYLYTIVGNLCTDHFRRKKEELPGNDTFFEEIPDESSLENTVSDRDMVERAMARLEPQDREIILLHFVSELPVTTVAKILGISRFAVHRRLKAAKEKLKKELEGSA